MTAFTDAIRHAARDVCAEAEWVWIEEQRIPAYVAGLLEGADLVSTLDAENHFIDAADREKTAAYVLALDSVNFGSGYFDLAQKSGVDLEYANIAHRLKDAFEKNRLCRAEEWVAADAGLCHDVFGIPEGAHPALDELTDLFALHLRETGERIAREYKGKVENLLAAAEGSAARLAEIVGAWAGFADIAPYKGRNVPVFKRAQILAADMNLALGGLGDMDHLTIFADNMVPHVLRHDGILVYDPAFAAHIDAGEMIPAGAAGEVELRMAAIHAVELMRQSATAQGHHVTSVNLDHLLWHRGYTPAFYEKPRHKTMTVWY